MKVGIILTLTVFIAFISAAIITGSIVISFAAAFAALFGVASIIWCVDFDTWNCFK